MREKSIRTRSALVCHREVGINSVAVNIAVGLGLGLGLHDTIKCMRVSRIKL